MTEESRAVARARAAAAAALAATALVLAVAVVPRAASASRRPVFAGVPAAMRAGAMASPSGRAFQPLRKVLRAAFVVRQAEARAAHVRHLRAIARRRLAIRADARKDARAHARALARARAHAHALARARAADRARTRPAHSVRRASSPAGTGTSASGGYTVVGHLTVETTAYWPDPAWSNGYTATGVRAQYGVVAVDPSVIPLGTHLYIPGYGQAVAEDTGGAIRGDHIDVCFDSQGQAVGWGVQYLTVQIERPIA